MGWETRNGRGRYYTRSRKVAGRVVREYLGCGRLAHEAAARDQRQREEHAALRAAWDRERQRRDVAEQLVIAYCAHIERAAREALTAAGFHLHARGEWRRARGRT
jgi:hypothetical protein